MMAAWGRHSFLYAWIYQIFPLLDNFRNPVKYLHPLNISLIILAGFGVEALCRSYLAPVTGRSSTFFKRPFTAFEKRWAIGCGVALAAAVVTGYFSLLD